jgi:DNA polymerase-1
VAFAKKHGYVETLFGRKIHTPEINAKGPTAGFAARAAINAPIQGTAADIIRRAMIRMEDAIAGLPARMLLQVHDELLFEVETDAVDASSPPRARPWRGRGPAVHLAVPLVVDAGRVRTGRRRIEWPVKAGHSWRVPCSAVLRHGCR